MLREPRESRSRRNDRTWEEAVVWDGKDGRERVFKWIRSVYTDTNSGDSKI